MVPRFIIGRQIVSGGTEDIITIRNNNFGHQRKKLLQESLEQTVTIGFVILSVNKR